MGQFLSLPTDLLCEIGGACSVFSLLKLAQVNHTFRHLANSDQQWEKLFKCTYIALFIEQNQN